MNLLKDGVYGLNCFFTPMSKVENTCTHAKRLPYFRVRALYKRPRSLPYRESPVQITSHSRGKSPRLQSDRKEYREFFAARNLVKLLCTRVHFDEIPPEKVDKYFPRQHAAHGHCVADLGRPLSAVITYPDGLIGVSCMPKRHAQRWHGGCLNIIRIFVPNVIYFGSKSSKGVQ